MSDINRELLSAEALIQQLVAIEAHRFNWLDEQFPHSSSEREEISELLDKYIQSLQSLIDKPHRFLHQLPFVIMNSDIEVELLSSKQRRVFRILPIYEDRIQAHDVSIISPMGRSLLLKETGSMVRVSAPGGELVYQIRSITMHHDG